MERERCALLIANGVRFSKLLCCSFAAGVSEGWEQCEHVQSSSGWSPFNFFKEENFSQTCG